MISSRNDEEDDRVLAREDGEDDVDDSEGQDIRHVLSFGGDVIAEVLAQMEQEGLEVTSHDPADFTMDFAGELLAATDFALVILPHHDETADLITELDEEDIATIVIFFDDEDEANENAPTYQNLGATLFATPDMARDILTRHL